MASFSGSNPTDSSNTVCVFTASGSFVPQFSGVVEVLVIAGGGGGGSDMGGGGGGGGVVSNSSVAVTAGVAVTVTVGAGGTGAPAGTGGHATTKGTNGGNSTFASITAIGGGAAGTSYYTFGNSWGNSGGSGGGGSGYNNGVTPALATGTGFGASGEGTAGQGFRGGWGQSSYYSGGGGGAGGAGTDANSQPNGGPGVANGILGVNYFWAGGGGGASYSLGTGGNGGIGGGGGGAVGVTTGGAGLNPGSPGGGGSSNSQTNTPGGNGGANTGGGGGGGSHYNFTNKGGDGGSGIVVVRFSTSLGSAAVGNATIINTDSTVLSLDAANIKSVPVFSAEVLVVAGGGGGGMDMGGGGGGGGVISNTAYSVTLGVPITVTVGAGGIGAPAGSTNGQPGGHQFTIPATSGGNSVFGALTAIGGGFGGSSYRGYTPGIAGGSGGSGGGSSGYNDNAGTFFGGAGTAGQGFRGGNSTAAYYSGGGGGAGGPGIDSPNSANGGVGVYNSILGTGYYWGGGGGGSNYSLGNGSNGGLGGGGGGTAYSGTAGLGGAGYNNGSNSAVPAGNGTPGGNAGANTGGGGGGGSHYNTNNKGGDGGSGIVVVRYAGPQRATGGTITTVGSDTVHTFTNSGTFTPNGIWTDLGNFGNNGTLLNTVGYDSANGGSLVFNGSNSSVRIGAGTGANQYSGNFAISIWVMRLTGGPTFGNVIGDYYTNSISTTNEWQIMLSNSGTITFYRVGSGSIFDQIPSGIGLNRWNNIVVTRIGTVLSLYSNSNLLASTNTSVIFGTPTGNLHLGIDGNSASEPLSGKIANVMIYRDRGLTATEVQQNFNALKSRYTGYQTMTYTATANMTLTNNGTQDVTMFKTSDNNSWNGEVRSTEAFSAPCTIEFSKQAASGDNGTSYVMIGWNEDPTSDTSYSSIDHASYPYRADIYSVYNNSSQVHFSGAWDVNKRFYIVYDTDGFVRHYNGSTLLYSANYGTNRTVFFDSSFYSVHPTFGGLTAVKVARSSWNGTNYV